MGQIARSVQYLNILFFHAVLSIYKDYRNYEWLECKQAIVYLQHVRSSWNQVFKYGAILQLTYMLHLHAYCCF